MENIPAVADDPAVLSNAEFVKLTIYNDVNDPNDVDIYTFSSSYREETIDGTVYSPMGGLLQVGIQQRDLRVTSADTSISLSGIDSLSFKKGVTVNEFSSDYTMSGNSNEAVPTEQAVRNYFEYISTDVIIRDPGVLYRGTVKYWAAPVKENVLESGTTHLLE